MFRGADPVSTLRGLERGRPGRLQNESRLHPTRGAQILRAPEYQGAAGAEGESTSQMDRSHSSGLDQKPDTSRQEVEFISIWREVEARWLTLDRHSPGRR